MSGGEGGAAPSRVVRLPVAQAYDRWAGAYDAYDNPMVFMASAAVDAMIGDLSGKLVVEFGCGTGRNLALMKARGARHLVGLDLSEGMLAQARRRAVADELVLHDISRETPLPDGYADLALFCLALEHVGDLRPPVREALRVVRPGGAVIIVEIHPFLSLHGAKAHFVDGGEEVHMPTHPHRFGDYLSTFGDLDMVLVGCREWRPGDVAGDLPAKVLKRGPDAPIVVSFDLRRPGG